MWQAGTSHSGGKSEVTLLRTLPTVSPGVSLQRVSRYGKFMTYSTRNGATVSFTKDQRGTLGVKAALLATTLATPSTTPAKRLIVNDTAPRQWQITCNRFGAATSR